MAHLTEENLIRCAEVATVRASWAVIAAHIGASEQTMYSWLHKSRKAEELHQTESPFFITWRDEQAYWHRIMARARRDNILSLEAIIRDEVRNGLETPIYDGNGRVVWSVDPVAVAQYGDDKEAAEGLGGYYDFPYLHDARGGRIQATRREHVPASLRQKVLAGLLPQTFGDKADVNVNHRGAIVHVIEPTPYHKLKAQHEADQQVVDGQFAEVAADGKPALAPPPLRKDIEFLRAEAARLMREGPKNPSPALPVLDANLRPVGSTKPVNDPPDDQPEPPRTIDPRDHPRAYMRPKAEPRPEPPHGDFPRHSDPRGKVAMKVR